MRRRPVLLSLLLTGALAATLPLAPSSGAAPGPSTVVTAGAETFAPKTVLNNAAGATTGGAEPSIEVDTKGNVFVSAPVGVPTGGCPFWEVHPDRLVGGKPYTYRGTIDTDNGGVGGGDCDISISPNASPSDPYDVVSVTSLSLANLTSNKTTDGGATFVPVANPASQQVFGVDRQWQAYDYGLDRHYLTVHDLATTNIQVSVSTDGGYQYVSNTPVINPAETPQALATGVAVRGVTGGNSFGTTVVNPVTHKLYVPFVAPKGQTFEGNTVYVAEGDPCATAPCTKGGVAGPITWTTHEVFSTAITNDLGLGFPAIAIDKAGRVYVGWSADASKAANAGNGQDANRIFVTSSAPGPGPKTVWSPPVAVDSGSGISNIFPWMVAGTDGDVGIAWYSSTTGACVGTAGPTTDVNDLCTNVWDVSWAASHDAGANWAVSTVSEAPIHRGAICTGGLSCPAGTRTLLDFFDVALDPQGRPHFAYNSDTRQRGTADIHYTHQCTGEGLGDTSFSGCLGTTTQAPAGCTASAAYTDPRGDATQVQGSETPAPNDSTLDVIGGRVSATATDLTFTVDVDDLTPPVGTGQYYEQEFTVPQPSPAPAKRFYVDGRRAGDPLGTTSSVGDYTAAAGGRRTLGDGVAVFDDDTDTVTLTLPMSLVGLKTGDSVGGITVTTRRDFQFLVPGVDVATSPCTYVVGAMEPDVAVPEVPIALVLPLAGAAVAGTVLLRRRRVAGRTPLVA